MIDAHMHCYFKNGDGQFKKINSVFEKENIDKAVLYLIEDNIFEKEIINLDFGNKVILGVMLDPRDKKLEKKLKILKEKGIKFIKLLPYEQRIYYEDFDCVVQFALLIQKYDMILTICGSYGSKDVFRTNGVELAAYILKAGFKNPLIIAHGGMVRQLEVHSLMCEYENLYFDLSFSILYWWGSHVIDDIFFTIKKANFEHIFWGSDYPDCSYENAKLYFEKFCDKYNISQDNKKKLLETNFEKFYEEFIK